MCDIFWQNGKIGSFLKPEKIACLIFLMSIIFHPSFRVATFLQDATKTPTSKTIRVRRLDIFHLHFPWFKQGNSTWRSKKTTLSLDMMDIWRCPISNNATLQFVLIDCIASWFPKCFGYKLTLIQFFTASIIFYSTHRDSSTMSCSRYILKIRVRPSNIRVTNQVLWRKVRLRNARRELKIKT